MTTLGQQLERARLQKGLTIRETSYRTRIPEQYINDLENDDYAHFDSLIYLKNFLSLYSGFLGLNCSNCLHAMQIRIARGGSETQYLATGHNTLEDTRRPRKKKAPGGGMPLFLAPIVVVLFAFVSFSLWNLFRDDLALPLPELSAEDSFLRERTGAGDDAAAESAEDVIPLPSEPVDVVGWERASRDLEPLDAAWPSGGTASGANRQPISSSNGAGDLMSP